MVPEKGEGANCRKEAERRSCFCSAPCADARGWRGWGRGALVTSSEEGAENQFGLGGSSSSTSRSPQPILSIRPTERGGDSSVTDLLQSKEESLDDANISGGWTGFTGTSPSVSHLSHAN